MKYLRILVGLVISLVCLYLAFRGVHLDDVGGALRRANYLWLVPATAAIIASVSVRTLRWKLLFHPRSDVRYGSLFGSLNAGYLVNDVLPMRLGEVVRAYLLSRAEPVSAPHALSTVAVERVLDVVTTLVCLALVLPFVTLPAGFSGSTVAVVSVVVLCGLAVMAILGARRHWAHGIGRIVTTRLPERHADRLHGLLDSFLDGFTALNNAGVALRIVVLSAAVWLLAALGLYFTMFAFDLYLAPSAPLFVLALVSLSFAVPASPGYVGVFEYTVKLALGAFAVSDQDATSYALVAHVIGFVPPMLLGAWYLWRAGIGWGRLLSFGKGVEAGSPAQPQPVGSER